MKASIFGLSFVFFLLISGCYDPATGQMTLGYQAASSSNTRNQNYQDEDTNPEDNSSSTQNNTRTPPPPPVVDKGLEARPENKIPPREKTTTPTYYRKNTTTYSGTRTYHSRPALSSRLTFKSISTTYS
ncbi:MAG: hypothetical protein JXR95_11770, partial [Deltaproteobacteria bacterium]|nr:hypothetical protein [Deltaproteobacteria bacterium]